MPRVHINIGSNLGDKQLNISRAIASLRQSLALFSPQAQMRISRPVESDAWGYDSANRYLNVGISFLTDLSAEQLLSATRHAEQAVATAPHRDASGAYIDRPIDIDIIFYGTEVISSPSLAIPHPRMHLRPFVLEPLADIDPLWRHPLTGLTAAQMLQNIEKSEKN